MRKFDFNLIFIFLIDLGLVYYAYLFTSLLIHNFQLADDEFMAVLFEFYWMIPVYVFSFYVFKLYSSLWEYASVEDAMNVFKANILSFGLIILLNVLFKLDIKINQLVLTQILLLLMLSGFRYSIRILKVIAFGSKGRLKKTIIIGAGSAGSLLTKEIKNNPRLSHEIVGLVDDDAKKLRKMINGYQVIGNTLDIPYIVSRFQIEEIIVCIPSLNESEYKRILHICEKTQAKVYVFPPFYQMINKELSYKNIREVKLEDLLGREEVKIDSLGLNEFLKDEVVLVTGGGGSIGSEICRQVVEYHPKKLIIFDSYENNAYEIQNELTNSFKVDVLIGSVQDLDRLKEVFQLYHPTVVFHAAAHKHVPLMEDSPKEAIKNNVFGTYHVAKLAHDYHVKKFVLISSDKAVNPTNIMGASKRLCEMIIEAFHQRSETQFSAVRFGNVLGSNGSVIPLFKKQIEKGGPVTVTHKDIIRYFMTIPEAVSLVLEAGAYAKGGEIFVLNMGEPVKILNLAENLIRFSGLEPYKDIDIEFTGLRKGEKLYEELLMEDENLMSTTNEKIFVLKQKVIDLSLIEDYLEELKYLVTVRNVNIKEVFQKMVPTYQVQV